MTDTIPAGTAAPLQPHQRLVIIGSGPAGYTAAVYAARAMLTPVLIQGIQPGGQLTITTEVENWPGDASVMGPDLMVRMETHAREMGARIVSDTVTRLDLSRRPFAITCDSGLVLTADAVILATGAQARWLGLESEKTYQGGGVSACATCDGFFYRGKKVAVVGGGNTAVEEALYLTHHASHVTLIHRRNSLRAERILQQRLFENPKISIIWDHVVEEITGTASPAVVTGLNLKHATTGEARRIEVDGVFIAIGHSPTTSLFHGQVQLDEEGYIITRPGTTETSIPGVFAAGDVQDKIYRQAVTAAGTGCMAALEVEKFLSHIPLHVSEAA